MSLACGVSADWFGWIAGALGLIGALLLARPLFILLSHREALDALVYSLDVETPPDELKSQFIGARKILAAKVFAGRETWKRWAYPAVGVLLLAIVPLCLQFVCFL